MSLMETVTLFHIVYEVGKAFSTAGLVSYASLKYAQDWS